MRKFIVATIVFSVLTFPALAGAHEAQFKRQIANLKASVDSIKASLKGQSKAIDGLYELADQLKKRLDTRASVASNQSKAIDDLYKLVDAIKAKVGMVGGASVPSGPKEPHKK